MRQRVQGSRGPGRDTNRPESANPLHLPKSRAWAHPDLVVHTLLSYRIRFQERGQEVKQTHGLPNG